MPARRGSTPVTDVRRGAAVVNEVRRGSTLVWSRSLLLLRDDFNRVNADTLGTAWTSHGPSVDRFIGVENNYARVIIPDGLIGGFWALRTSRMRYNAAKLGVDNGYVECRMSTIGSSQTALSPLVNGAYAGFISQIFGRLSDSAFTHGVGLQMVAGHVWIVRRVSNVEVLMADGGTFQAGDVLRLSFSGNVHTLTRNGAQVTQWNDSAGSALSGAAYRSMGIRGDGGKDLLGPRRFSPAFDYVEMG